MKAGAEKSSSTTQSAVSKTTASPFFAKQGQSSFFSPTRPSVQAKMTVGKPGDKFEQEADTMAGKVMRMPAPAPMPSLGKDDKLRKKEDDKLQKAPAPEDKLQKKEDDKLQKAPEPEQKLQKKEENKLQNKEDEKLQRKEAGGAGSVSSSAQSAITGKMAGGQPLSNDVRSFMEPRFNADFGNVRVHSDRESTSLSNQLSARAFTYQNHIFFSRDQYQPGSSEGKQLLAHELTHTIQQGHAVQRAPQVSTTTTPPPIQRIFGIEIPNVFDIAGFIADKARIIPGFTMLTVVIGLNPITGASVDRSAGNILQGAIEMIPVVGPTISDALNNHGIFSKVSTWAAPQFDTLKAIGNNLWENIKSFIKSLSGKDLLSPGDAWERGKAILTNPIAQIKALAIGLKDGIITFIKDAILKPIAAFAKANAPNGYDLLCAVLGKDPISGEPVQQTAENLIAPFMKLIGQEEVWENMKKSGAIQRAWAWFQNALGAVKGFVNEIPGLFIAAFKALEVIDIVLIPRAFSKLVGVFGGFVGRFISWAGTAVWNLLEIIFDAVKPGLMGYIKKTGAALKGILKNPMPFLGNLVNAAKLGFTNFASNFGGHLKNGLLDWLTGALSGVYIPRALSLAELGKFALSVLGITWAGIRAKIVKALEDKDEKIVSGIEKGVEWAIKGFEIVQKLATGGIAAAWEMVQEKLNDLKDQVISGIVSFVTDTIVKKAIPKLIGMFIPGAGFIPAIISIYDTIMVFVEKLTKIFQVVTAFIDSIVAIAGGAIGAAAKRVESVLAGLLSLAISFLAGFLGLGKVTDKIKEVIKKFQATVDKAIDAAIKWIVDKAKALWEKLFGKKDKKDKKKGEGQLHAEVPFAMNGAGHTLSVEAGPSGVRVNMASEHAGYLKSLINGTVGNLGKRKSKSAQDVQLVDALNSTKEYIIQLENSTYSGDISGNERKVAEEKLRDGLTQASTKLIAIGQAFQMKDLADLKHPSVHVGNKLGDNQWSLLPEDSTDKGGKYYRSYRSDKDAWIRKRQKDDEKEPGGKPNYWKDRIDKNLYHISIEATIDHKIPVATHWNQQSGRDMAQNNRIDWFNEKNNWQLATRPNNSSEGAKGENNMVNHVGIGFRGPRD